MHFRENVSQGLMAGAVRRPLSTARDLLAFPGHRAQPLLADGKIIDPDRETVAGGRLIIRETDRQCLEGGGNFDAFIIARALVLADVGDFLAVDEELI